MRQGTGKPVYIGLSETEYARQELPLARQAGRRDSNVMAGAVMSHERLGEKPATQVTLSKEEVDFAKALGITLEECARGKLRMCRELANGERQR